jgi:1D-myo-inositol 3-kinase
VNGPIVVVCGHVTLDHLPGGIAPGGSAFYAGRALAALGAAVRVLTAAGPDFPRHALAGLDVALVASQETTAFVNSYAPDGSRTQRALGSAPALDPARLPAAWRSPDALLLAPVLGEVDVPAFSAAAGARLVGVCVQGLVREVGADGAVQPRRLALDRDDLAGIRVAFVGEDEARGDPGLVHRLAAVVPIVAFTHGARGCEVFVRGRPRRVGIHPAREIDPTGAGDVFAAAFLLGLSRGDDPVDAARLGAAAASIAVEGRGGDSLSRVGEAIERAGRVPVLE